MSLIEQLRGQSAAKPSEVELAEAETELARLEAEHADAAVEALGDSPAAKQRLAGVQAQLATERPRVAPLRAAYRAAVESDEATIVIRRAALQRTQLAAVRKHIQARAAAAVALSEAITKVAEHYHVLLERSAKAQAACPVGMSWPNGALCDAESVRELVSFELFRLSASPGNRDDHALPGATLPGLEYEYQPSAIPPMSEQFAQASANIIAALTRRAPE